MLPNQFLQNKFLIYTKKYKYVLYLDIPGNYVFIDKMDKWQMSRIVSNIPSYMFIHIYIYLHYQFLSFLDFWPYFCISGDASSGI